jgi:MFS transporter, SHS family, sialic acid transporter
MAEGNPIARLGQAFLTASRAVLRKEVSLNSTPINKLEAFQYRAVLIAAFLGWMFDGLEMGMFPLIARPALRQMQHNSIVVSDAFVGHWMGVITALFLLGAALGGVFFGWLGDRMGRVGAMSICILTYSLFTGTILFAQTPAQLGALRFFAAFGMGGEWSLGVALVMEIWPDKHRSMLAGLIGAANNVGFLLIALIGMAIPVTEHSWRWVALLGALPALLVFWIIRYVPESERWKKAAATGHLHPLAEIAGGPLLKTTVIACALSGIALIGSWGSVQWLPLWADKMAGPGLPAAKAYTQALIAVGAIIGALIGAWLSKILGRRPAYFVFSLGSLLSCALLFRAINQYGAAFLLLAFWAGMITTTFYGWMPLYLPELFPTRVRATGQGIALNAGRVLAAFGAIQMGVLMQSFKGSYARAGAVITLVYALGLLVIWLGPETKGRLLPE